MLGEYGTAREALLAKKDHLQFLNAEHGSFTDEVQQAIQQLSSLQNIYGDNLYTPVAPNPVQETLDADALESEFDPLYDGDVNIKKNALEDHNANHQETTTNDNGDLQAALFDDTDNNILSRRQVTDLCFKMAGNMCQHLHIYGGTYSQWWNSIQTCDKGMIPPTQRY